MEYQWSHIQPHDLSLLGLSLFIYGVMRFRMKKQQLQTVARIKELFGTAVSGEKKNIAQNDTAIFSFFKEKIDQKIQSSFSTHQELLSLAAELAHVGPWKFHPESRMFEFNDEFYAILGTSVAREGAFKTREEYFRDFVHPDDRWMFESPDLQKNYLHRIVRRDGQTRIVEVQCNIVKDGSGNIINWYGAMQDVTEHKMAEVALSEKTEQLHQIAYTDELTGLPNRARLKEWIDVEMERARTEAATGCIFFIDLDDLKTVNDSLGHNYGDAIIVEEAKRIAEQFYGEGFIGRSGGDEFIVICPKLIDRQQIASKADQLISSLHQDITARGEVFRLSASVGIAAYPVDGATTEELLKNANNAMHFAKNFGKNCWKFYDQQMQIAAIEKMRISQKMHRALAQNDFSLVYQPLIHTAGGSIIGFEALMRWTDTEDGPIPPSQFIPVAESNGLIKAMGNWVLQEACRFAKRLADSGWKGLYVAVNVSPHQLRSEQFIENVRDAIQNAGILPQQLGIEITENALMISLQDAISQLNMLKRMGIRLALDDFGTGYSSLTYLQQLPVQTLKIDKSFIEMIHVDKTKTATLNTIVDLAHQMQMSVVAEGVETEDQRAYLLQTRCDIMQGFLFSRPVPEADAFGLLLAH